MQHSLLSTKHLTASQRELVLNSGLGLVDYDILKIHQLDNYQPPSHQHLIITSSNAIPGLKAVFGIHHKVYCVGQQTASKLQEMGVAPVYTANNAKDLAEYLIHQQKDQSFSYLCSPQRRKELPDLLQAAGITLEELFVYESVAVMKSFDRIFAAVTFYSPRGVDAFAKANPHDSKAIAICIGHTTAAKAREYYDQVVVARLQSVENTLVTAIKALRT
ncbi:uroporphyrinogen-III synthase [Nonlabens xiamenensis]|uniref:uroporphyrinogen-III synthase n=1 Tax=Nonlabens xiamenensis TaxID=2341043 RepID=UPI000F60B118|nr:uroporphyrinogen-III synthase [Nonlabens xiamenensis]